MLSLARVFHEVKECHVRQRYVLCPIVICGTLAEEWCVQEVKDDKGGREDGVVKLNFK